MKGIYHSNIVTYSSNINFNFSETIHFNSESTILFSFYHQLNSESSIFVACAPVASKTLIMDFSNSFKTCMKKSLDMFPVNYNNPNSYYYKMVIKFSGFVCPGVSENSSQSCNISNKSRIDSIRSEHIQELQTTFTQPSINLASDNLNHSQHPNSRPLTHELEKRIDEQVQEYYVDPNMRTTIWQHPDMITDEIYRRINLVFNTGWNVINENYNSTFLYKYLNIKAGTNTLVLQIQKGREIKIIDKYFGFLPEGWEMRLDIATSLTYFAEHIAKNNLYYYPRFKTCFNIRSFLPTNCKIRHQPRQFSFFPNRNAPENTTYIDPRIGLDSYASGDNFIKCVQNTHKKNLILQKLCKKSKYHKLKIFTFTRENILEDSFAKIMSETCMNLRSTLSLSFFNEDDMDYGGVTREWFYQITYEITNPIHCLFKTYTPDNYYIQINPNSFIKPNYLIYFRFVGRILAMALFHGYFIYGGYDINFYKRILGRRRAIEDLKITDNVIYNSLKWICENDIEREELELYFCTESDVFGKLIMTELIPGGKDIRVNQSNKFDYVYRITEWTLNANTSEQMNAIKTAFFEIIPWSWVAFFDEKELELLLCGIKSYDIHDWKKNTEYGGGYCYKSKQIKWFWTLVESFESEQIGFLLKFATGTSRIPFTGFCDLNGANCPQKFNIQKWGVSTHLPRSHTCSNRIHLPPYNTYEELKSKLLTAIEESSGFHLY